MIRTTRATFFVVFGVLPWFVLTMIWAYRATSVSLDAERTLGASYLVLDLLTVYVRESSRWPANWDDLKTISPESYYPGFKWPTDLDEIQRRIRVDFVLSVSEVAAMNLDNFTAVQPIGASYGLHEGRVKCLLNVARASAESEGQVLEDQTGT